MGCNSFFAPPNSRPPAVDLNTEVYDLKTVVCHFLTMCTNGCLNLHNDVSIVALTSDTTITAYILPEEGLSIHVYKIATFIVKVFVEVLHNCSLFVGGFHY